MVSPLLYGAFVILVAFVLAFFVPVLYAQGKWLRCPECGEVFKAPAMDVRTTGLGLSPPYFGRVVCPKCNQAKRRGKFLKVSRPEGSGAS